VAAADMSPSRTSMAALGIRVDRPFGLSSRQLARLHGGISQMVTRSMLTSVDALQGVATCRQTYEPTQGRTDGRRRLRNDCNCRTRRLSVATCRLSAADRHHQSMSRVQSSGFPYCREDAANCVVDQPGLGGAHGAGGGGSRLRHVTRPVHAKTTECG
jgi:hypothetical protein